MLTDPDTNRHGHTEAREPSNQSEQLKKKEQGHRQRGETETEGKQKFTTMRASSTPAPPSTKSESRFFT